MENAVFGRTNFAVAMDVYQELFVACAVVRVVYRTLRRRAVSFGIVAASAGSKLIHTKCLRRSKPV